MNDTPIPHYTNSDPMATDYQLFPEITGQGSLITHIRCNSSSRVQMVNSQYGQALVIKGATPRRQQTGTEREFGRFTFSKTFDRNVNILAEIERYPFSVGVDTIVENPETVYIYEDAETGEIGMMSVPRFNCNHQYFGFKYQFNKEVTSKLFAGAHIPAGSVVAHSPSLDKDGNYNIGRELNVVYLSLPGVIEDGVIIADDVLPEITAKGFKKYTESAGRNHMFLNLYADKNNPGVYKPFPDIGDLVREDGLLFATRPYDPLLAPVEMSVGALQEVDYVYDRLTYVTPGARVVDVVVHHDDTNRNPPTPVGMERQMNKYHQAAMKFYQKILDVYNKLRKSHEKNLVLSPELHRLIVEALGYVNKPNSQGQQVTKTYRRQPLDDWRVEITIEFDTQPTDGAKVSGGHGNKGVICQVWPAHRMPVDAEGNRADIIMEPYSVIKRMNLGCMYEPYINASADRLTKQLRELFGFNRDGSNVPKETKQLLRFVTPMAQQKLDPVKVDIAYKKLLRFYEICSPWMVQMMSEPDYPNAGEPHVMAVLRDGIYLWMPNNNPIDYPTMIDELRAEFPPVYGPVKFIGYTGKEITTKESVLIGSAYIIVLEKTGGDWSGVSSAKLQHHGIPAKITKSDKNSYPGAAQPVRMTGEAEVRLGAATCGGEVWADIIDQSNNPTVGKEILANIYRADKPTDIKEVIDRKEFPVGNGRNNVFVDHILECAGMRFVYKKQS
ncbi:DNA-directed RNA polymerase subunit beta [compost metagenome]